MEESEHHKNNANLLFDLFFKKSISSKIFHNNKARYFSVRTSGTPSPCCRGGRPAWSSASGRCSGSGRRGYTSPRQPCTPRWWRSPGPTQRHRGCILYICVRHLVGLALDAQVHDVVAADGAVVHHDIPGPQRHRVPLLHLEPLLVLAL